MILITGGMGFIGLHTAKRFLDLGEEVLLTQYRVRREPEFIREQIGGRVTVARLDVTDERGTAELVKRYHVTGIVHLAGPGRGVLSIAEDYRAYLGGLLSIMEAALGTDVQRITLAGAIGVYSGLARGPFHEDAALPIASKASSEAAKKAWEILASRFTDQTGIEIISLRIPIVYGPLYYSMANLPSRLCHAAVHGTALDLRDLRAGTAHADDAHDFCFVRDCAAGIQLTQMAGKLRHRIYNIGGGRAATNQELAQAAQRAAGCSAFPLPAGHSEGSRPDPYLDLERIRADVGYEPEYDLERGVEEYVEWLRHNPT